MIVSASQIENHQLCARKWWFQSVKKVPTLPKSSTTFGTVLHSVAERYHKADDLGRGPDGKPVELFPKGWEISPEGVALTPGEMAYVQTFTEAAITEGVWDRPRGRQVEWGFIIDVTEQTELMGYVDLLLPEEVRDHKTTSKRRYAKSAAAIAKSDQMLIYGYALLAQRQLQGSAPISRVTLRHNTFCLDTKQVLKTSTDVPVSNFTNHWETSIRPRVQKMEKHQQTRTWTDFDEPPPDACNAFGGCPFLAICSGKQKMEDFSNAVLQLRNKAAISSDRPKRNSDMATDFKKTLANLRGTAPKTGTASAQAPAPAPTKTAAPAPAPAPAPTPAAKGIELAGDPAPWAQVNCTACKGSGFNSRGAPCPICESVSRKKGGPSSKDYDVHVVDGVVAWTPKEGVAGASVTQTAPEATVKEKATVTAPTPTIEPDPVENPKEPKEEPAAPKTEPDPVENPKEPKEEPPPPVEEAPVENPKEPKALGGRAPGRPKISYRLLIGTANVGGSAKRRETRTAEQIFAELSAKIVANSKELYDYDYPDFWTMPAFAKGDKPGRRDVLRSLADQAAPTLGAIDIVVTTVGPDMAVLVEALRAYADETFEALGRA